MPWAFFFAEKRVELIQARFAAIAAAEPDRSMAFEVADHDPVGVALADRDLVETDDLRARSPGALELLGHVLLLEPLDRLPVEVLLGRDIADGAAAATAANVARKAPRVQRVLQQELQPLGLHTATATTVHTPDLEVQVDAMAAAGQIPCAAVPTVVPAAVNSAAAPAGRFFPRRTRVTSRARGSPNIPSTRASGRNPGNVYASASRRNLRALGIAKSCQVSTPSQPSPNCLKSRPGSR